MNQDEFSISSRWLKHKIILNLALLTLEEEGLRIQGRSQLRDKFEANQGHAVFKKYCRIEEQNVNTS